jgi:photosystem II stability/assembly factor-like uncharacterized protein
MSFVYRRRRAASTLAFWPSLFIAILLVLSTSPAPARAAAGAWSKLDLDGIQVSALAVDPTVPSTLYAGSRGNGMFRSTNGGASWQSINTGLGSQFVNAISIDPSNPSIVLAGTGRGALVGEPGGGVYRTTNRGNSWTGVLVNTFSSSLARTFQNPQVVYSGGVGPVNRSTDGGVTWTRLTPPPNSPILNTDILGLAVSPFDPNLLIAVGNTEGGTGRIFRSTDGGNNWTLVRDGLAPVFNVAFAPPSPAGANILVASQVGVLRSTDNGLSYQLVTEELGNISVRQVIFNPSSATTAFAATDQGVFTSLNGGNDWTPLDTTLGNRSVRSLAIDTASPQTLYAGTDDGVWEFTLTAPPPPPFTPVTTVFFAEGSTQPPFDTWFLVQNPGGTAANVRFTFQFQGGGTAVRSFVVGPTSRFSLFANQVIPGAAFSTRIDADQPIRAERAMYVSFDGDDVTAIPAPNRTWLFAEGSTQPPFHTWLLLQNPNNVPATATITYFLLGGGAPRTQVLGLPPLSRTSVFVNLVLPNAAFSSRINSDQPIVVERALYRFPGNAATAEAGLNAPATTFFFPNARTGTNLARFPVPFDSFLLLENPNPTPTTATITLFMANGNQVTFTQGLAANSRQSVFLNQVLPNASFGVRVQAGQPIIAERSMFFGTEPRGAMNTIGSPDLATQWFLAEGSTQFPFTEFLFILNPNTTTMTARIDFQLPGGQVVTRNFTIGPTRALTLNVNDIVPNSPVSATVTTSLPSVVERQMFFTKLGSLGGHDATAIR